MGFVKANKKKSKLRLAIDGASGSGKTFSSLTLGKGLGEKIAVIDTEHGSASLYSDKFDFDVLELKPPYSPERYIEAIEEAEKAGYDVLVIDSLSHEWNGAGGCLDMVNQIGGNSYTAWGKVTPRHDKLINKILSSTMHIIATMRSKANYETGKDEKTGKMTVQKQGTAPIQREGMDFEFTIVFDLNMNHCATATKDRSGIFDGKDEIITENTAKKLLKWLNDGGDPNKDIVSQVKEILKGEEQRNLTDEAAKCLTLPELGAWWNSLTPDEKKQAEAVKNNRKAELTAPITVDEANAVIDAQQKANQSAKDLKVSGEGKRAKKVKDGNELLISAIDALNANTPEKEYERIDLILVSMRGEEKPAIYESFKNMVEQYKPDYEIQSLPF